jgi:hypothetical protein
MTVVTFKFQFVNNIVTVVSLGQMPFERKGGKVPFSIRSSEVNPVFFQTMLQWTCRLRDTLERRGWLTNTSVSKQLTFMREAEFVGTNGSFPDDFRWEALQNCCYTSVNQDLVLRDPKTNVDASLVPAIDPIKGRSCRYIRRLCGQPAIDVTEAKLTILWLSPKVFICSDCFSLEQDPVPEYSVSFLPTPPNDARSFNDLRFGSGWYAYSFSSFDDTESYERLTLPMEFLSHVAASVEMSYFAEIGFSRTSPERCPIDYAFQFFSIFFPQDAPAAADSWTVCQLDESFLNADELR